MKTKLLIISVLGIVVILALIALLLGSEETTEVRTAPPVEEVIDTNQTATPETGVGSLLSLRERSGPLECSFTYRSSELSEQIEGTFFLRNGRVRADFLQEDPTLGQLVTSYIIRDDRLYVWSTIEGEQYGVEIPLTEETVDAPLPIPEDENVRYSCTEWVRVDDSIFEVPTNVLFRDAIEADIEYGTIYEEGEFPF